MENQEKKQPNEAELRRLLALDKARVEESFAKNKAIGKKIGGVIAVAIILVAAITVFIIIAISSRK